MASLLHLFPARIFGQIRPHIGNLHARFSDHWVVSHGNRTELPIGDRPYGVNGAIVIPDPAADLNSARRCAGGDIKEDLFKTWLRNQLEVVWQTGPRTCSAMVRDTQAHSRRGA